ncbi:MAG: hypothetical protein ABI867_10945 [Kofleriaceae bacterium]
MRAWARRTAELQREFAAIADPDPRWWLLASGVAFAEVWAPPDVYLASDAEADADTFMGYPAPRPRDPVTDAIVRARAAQTALRELDGELPDQTLAVTIHRTSGGAIQPSTLEVAAFAIGHTCVVGRIDDPTLPAQLTAVLAGGEPHRWHGAAPFVCVAIGDEPVETARHGHRRAWDDAGGPWLGLGRAGELAVVSTCHLIVDGYGHARIAARIAQLAVTEPSRNGHSSRTLAPVVGAVPLAVTWRELTQPSPRVIPLAYAAGRILHRTAGKRDAKFSPTLQIPVARGHKDDPMRLRRRVVSATTSVRFEAGEPEPFAVFEARVRASIAREANASGLVSRLLAAARAVPVPLSWKRKSIGAKRPRWLESFAQVIGGRALLSRIAIDAPIPPLCAVSSPSRLATDDDPVGGCVITIVDDNTHAAITVCGSGFAGTPAQASAFLDELLASI